jgi:transaldolase
MKLFAAGAALADLESCLRLGLCAGVVLDQGAPALASAGARRELVTALGRLVDGPVFVPATGPGASGDAAALEGAARELAALGTAVVPRLPFGQAGLAAARACAKAGLVTNLVGCTTPTDALAAARAGGHWISPAWDLPADATARGALFEPMRRVVSALASFEGKAEVLMGAAPDRSILVDLAFVGAHAGSARPDVVHEIARRRAEGLADAKGS